MNIMNHIELFAGCGGLSLGLELAGFELTLANELSPMASETYAYNFLNENLRELADSNEKSSDTLWLSSRYPDLNRRLRENPFEYPKLYKGESDMPDSPKSLKGKLIVGNIIQLNKYLRDNPKMLSELKSGFGKKGVDLVSGGPPCQSFSLAGLRKRDCDKNTLPMDFANFVELIKPKIVMLENVSGILRPFKENGISYYAWFEIAKVFASKGYIPLCIHINARKVGVPQNRPRFIMIAINNKIYTKLKTKFTKSEGVLFNKSKSFFDAIKKNKPVKYDDLHCFDIVNVEHLSLFKDSFLSPLIGVKEVSVKESIDDLRFNTPTKKSRFVTKLNKTFEGILGRNEILTEHDARRNNEHVQRRFRLYQILQKINNKKIGKEVFSILKQNANTLSDEAWKELKSYNYFLGYNLMREKQYIKFDTKDELETFLLNHPTKKQTQKALVPNLPAPAALSIPDDACHYDEHELRTLTVREMARIQSFPDSFKFKSKVTTGGKMRRFEVPQYTQVGNAVPPLLGLALGKAVKQLLEKI